MGNGGSLHPYGSKHRQDLKSWKKVGFLNNQVGTEFLMKVVNRACVRYLWREKLQSFGLMDEWARFIWRPEVVEEGL